MRGIVLRPLVCPALQIEAKHFGRTRSHKIGQTRPGLVFSSQFQRSPRIDDQFVEPIIPGPQLAKNHVRGQTRDWMPRQGSAEITRHARHGSNGFLVGPDNERELALALASCHTMNPGAALSAPPRAAPFSRDLPSAGWPKTWLASTRIQWL
jgi:hypothetical protein